MPLVVGQFGTAITAARRDSRLPRLQKPRGPGRQVMNVSDDDGNCRDPWLSPELGAALLVALLERDDTPSHLAAIMVAALLAWGQRPDKQ